MRIYDTQLTRAGYLRTQIERSDAKFGYCKVSVHDVRKYADIIRGHRVRIGDAASIGPVACLGTRNGREIDLFRVHFFGPRWLRAVSLGTERRHPSFAARFAWVEGRRRSRVEAIGDDSVVGVELNPRAARSDVWTGSFDAMPASWTRRFGVVYSNSFDQSEDPARTAGEWRRILREGGYLVCCFSKDAEPTVSDPVGGLSLADVRALFPGDLIYSHERGSRSGYSEAVLRMSGAAA